MFIELTKGLDGDVLVWKFWQTTEKTEDNTRAARQWAVSGPVFLHQNDK